MVQSEGHADKGKMGEYPELSAQLLAGVADLLGVEPEMVDSGKHLLERQARFVRAADAVSADVELILPLPVLRAGFAASTFPYVVW
ncbi:hypothetical protein ACFU5O_30360 [Streptomyces sp. NPDC057445]|uniref:hypothetical protein n=1 Tax=Streptomyces sp. NPDC057445 TaxID=3346136 RepID=UPI0036AE0BE6